MGRKATKTRWETIEGAIDNCYNQGDFLSAQTILRFALHESEWLGEMDLRILQGLHRLVLKVCEQHRYDEAARLCAYGLEVGVAVFGWSHPDFVGHRKTLAAILEEIETPVHETLLSANSRN